jgi:hypothetical protein
MRRVVTDLALGALSVALGAWGTAALYYGDSRTGALQIAFAAAFGACALATLIGLYRLAWRRYVLGGFALVFAGVLGSTDGCKPLPVQFTSDSERFTHRSAPGIRTTLDDSRTMHFRLLVKLVTAVRAALLVVPVHAGEILDAVHGTRFIALRGPRATGAFGAVCVGIITG